MKCTSTTFLTLGGLPLLLYPFVLLAGIMSLAGHSSGDEPALLVAVVNSFLWGSLVYPAVYVPCWALARSALKANKEKVALRVSMAPLFYLGILVVLMLAWSRLQHSGSRSDAGRRVLVALQCSGARSAQSGGYRLLSPFPGLCFRQFYQGLRPGALFLRRFRG